MSLLDAALDYAGRGWPVFPLQPRDKVPATRNGFKDATTDTERIRAWWARHPDSNLGVPTGVAFDVLDLDTDDAGPALAQLAADAGHLVDDDFWRDGPMSRTGKGSHLLYAPTGAGNRTRVAGLDGVDWRGNGGYVVVPPSVHPTGHVYAWGEHNGPDAPLEPAHPWLAALVLPRPASAPRTADDDFMGRRGGYTGSGLIATLAAAPDGTRNTVLHWCACRLGEDLRARRTDPAGAERVLDELALVAERIGLSATEVAATIESGFTRGRAA